MKITIIGAGKAANFLVKKFQMRSIQLYQVYNRTQEKAQLLATKSGAEYISSLSQLDPETDVVFYAVNDGIVSELAHQLSFSSHTLHVNMSGSNDLKNFPKEQNWCTIWPIYSLNDTSYLKEDIPVAMSLCENKSLQQLNEKLAYLLSNTIFEISNSQRTYAHLCAVIANNFVNFLNVEMFKIVNKEHINPKMLTSIISQTYENNIRLMDHSIQTGPAARGDIETIQNHLSLLADKPELQAIYKLISDTILSQSR